MGSRRFPIPNTPRCFSVASTRSFAADRGQPGQELFATRSGTGTIPSDVRFSADSGAREMTRTSLNSAALPLEREVAIATADEREAAMAGDVREGLRRRQKELPPKYFYDERGSELFERITRLPEYYLTPARKSTGLN